MAKVKNAFTMRIAAIVLSFAMIMSAIPIGLVSAQDPNDTTVQYGTYSAITEAESITVADASGAASSIHYEDGLTLDWAAADPSIGRNNDGWWVGVQMTAPGDLHTQEDFAGVNFRSKGSGDWSEPCSFWDYKDSAEEDTQHYITFWGFVTPEKLNDALMGGSDVTFCWEFDWDKDGTYEQTANLSIDPNGVTLTKEGAQVYPTAADSLGSVEALSDGLTLDSANSNLVAAAYGDSTTLSPDTTTGNYPPASLRVKAPAGWTEEASFANVTYQSNLNGAGWSAAANFWADKTSGSDAAEPYLDLSIPITQELLTVADAPLQYAWRFDWDGDGTYEQAVSLEIDPAKIALLNAGGAQVYPVLGTVEAKNSNLEQVSGTGTGAVTVTLPEDTSLSWSPVDQETGLEAGWCTGVAITAPEWADVSEVTYQTTQVNVAHGSAVQPDWSTVEAQAFASNGQSGTNAMDLWVVLDRASFEAAQAGQQDIVTLWQFDWDSNGTYEQTVIFTIDANSVTLSRVDLSETDFQFEQTVKEVWIGSDTYTVKTISNVQAEKISYRLDQEDSDIATIDSETGVITFQATGRVTVYADFAQTDVYNEKTISFTFDIVKKDSTGIQFSEKEIETTYGINDNKYINEAYFVNAEGEAVSVEEVQGTKIITYSIENPDTENPVVELVDGGATLKILRAGSVTVRATHVGDNDYNVASDTYTLTIHPADQDAEQITIDGIPAEITYDPDGYDLENVQVNGSPVNEPSISYGISSVSDVATMEGESSHISLLKSGVFTLDITIGGDDCYNSVTVSKEIKVNLAAQTGFQFSNGDPDPITYNDNGNEYLYEADGGQSTGEITYRILSSQPDLEVATIDEATGKLIIIKAGTVVVEATKAGDDCYQSATATYQLTINKDTQGFSFTDGDQVLKTYGITEYFNATVDDDNDEGKEEIVYSISENNIGASLSEAEDTTPGTVVFGDSTDKIGSVTVTATRAANEYYEACTKQYTLEIVYLDPPQPAYTIQEAPNDNGWYNSEITIEAPKGYTISFDNALSYTDWSEKVKYGTESTQESYNVPVVYLKAANGGVTGPITVENYQMDQTQPKPPTITYEQTVFDKVLETITFGFFKAPLTVTVTSSDDLSGLERIEFSYEGTTNQNSIVAVTGEETKFTSGSATFIITSEFQGTVSATAYDLAGNPSVPTTVGTAQNEAGEDVSPSNIVVDGTAPVRIVTLSQPDHVVSNEDLRDVTNFNNTGESDSNNILYYRDSAELNIQIVEGNFYPEDVQLTVNGQNIGEVSGVAYNPDGWESSGDGVWSNAITISAEGDYVVAMEYQDRSGNTMVKEIGSHEPAPYESPKIVIDHNNPIIEVEYDNNDVKNIVGERGYYDNMRTATITITEENFRADDVQILVTAKDAFGTDLLTPNADGYAETYFNQGAARSSWSPYELDTWRRDDNIYTMTLVYSADANYTFDILYEDLATRTADDWPEEQFTIDTITPTRTATLSNANRVVSNGNLQDITDYNYTSESSSNAILYYNTQATATLEIKEANFFQNEVEVLINNMPASEVSGVAFSNENWTPGENYTWSNTITITQPGDYVVTMNYKDKSNHSMEQYTSPRIVIDHTPPTVDVKYNNNNVIHTMGDRAYFNATRTATITIVDENFRADEVRVLVTAEDAVGNSVLGLNSDGYVASYFNQGTARSSWSDYVSGTWRRNDNTYIMTLVYSADANYTFDIVYEDLAANPAADYAQQLFTVDTTVPKNLTVSYSEPQLWDQILEHVTFGFYNAQMTVTITAEDDTTPVNYFRYSYQNSEGVSGVNAELINEIISSAGISYNGKTATATFTIPKLLLNGENQFNGNVSFTAFDRSENNTEFIDGNRIIVVDNITPTSQITFNDPVQTVNDVSYYNGDINVTIIVNEANFYSEDVQVVVTRDGANYPVSVNWTDNSVDVHTGTFTLSGDGDYIVNVSYTDRSTNEMVPYVSNQLTIDTVDPVISVSNNLRYQSANNQDTIGFTISVTDRNIPFENFRPSLSAVIRRDNGNDNFTYETVAVDLGQGTTSINANGETVYQYTVNNLDTDGYYSLTCTAVDYAGHSVSAIQSTDNTGGTVTVDSMDFSVNREGSVFWIETEHNDKYTGETFTNQLNSAYANDNVTVQVHEVNVDRVDEDPDHQTIFTLNDGSASEDVVLTEDTGNGGNYEKNVNVGAGGWYENIYTLNNDNFNHDGVYSINIITYDAANNSNVNTKSDSGTISFTLDRTQPVITSNVTNDERINEAEFPVEFEITEANLDPSTILVKLDGEEVGYDDLGNNEYTFVVENGLNRSIQITAKDLAGNESELYQVDRLTVSTNILVLWYANTPLFWGTIGGLVLLAGVVILLIFLKKRKKDEEEDS